MASKGSKRGMLTHATARRTTGYNTNLDELKSRLGADESAQEVKKKRLNVDIPETMHQAFKSKVAGEGRKMSAVVQELIETYLLK